MEHLHCQDCGAHFTNRAEQDAHRCQPCPELGGQRGALAADAAGGVQERPAAGRRTADRTTDTRTDMRADRTADMPAD